MTAPQFDITTVVPAKYKPWVGLIGSLLTFIVPTVTTYATNMPQPWPVVIAGIIAALTWLGIYKAPYAPTGTVLVPEAELKPNSGLTVYPATDYDQQYKSPWRTPDTLAQEQLPHLRQDGSDQ